MAMPLRATTREEQESRRTVVRSTPAHPRSRACWDDAPLAISVIVPVLNAAATIGTQLSSLARQTYGGAWEVIVADNGSRDRSPDLARAFADRLPHFRVLDASRVRGVAHARNAGVRAARAPIVAFVDADDEVADDWLEHMAAALQRHEAVASRFDSERLNPPELRSTRNLAQKDGLGQHDYAPFLPHAGGSGFGVRVDIHDAIGGFDERLLRLQDTDYCWRLQLAGHAIHFERKAVVHVRFRSAGAASFAQAFGYGRFNGHLYHRYRRHGMPHVPLTRDLKRLLIMLVRAPYERDWLRRERRWRTIANLSGIMAGRIEATLFRHRQR